MPHHHDKSAALLIFPHYCFISDSFFIQNEADAPYRLTSCVSLVHGTTQCVKRSDDCTV